ncbi:MAG: hypothetical protein KDI55_07250, partial [Anaerolineae bacterium]|nr:hypothetical protein [Anaerolineae bacterium]
MKTHLSAERASFAKHPCMGRCAGVQARHAPFASEDANSAMKNSAVFVYTNIQSHRNQYTNFDAF